MKKQTKRKARKAPAKKARRANPKTAAQTKRTARPTNGSLAIPGALKNRLSEMAKAAGSANWKRHATEILTKATQA